MTRHHELEVGLNACGVEVCPYASHRQLCAVASYLHRPGDEDEPQSRVGELYLYQLRPADDDDDRAESSPRDRWTFAPCATTKTFFLASIFGLQRRKTRARRSFVSPLPRVVGSHPASPFFVSPAVNLENDRALPRRVPVVGVSTCAPTTRTRLAARFFFLFLFHLGLFPAGVSPSSSESPGSRPPSYQHRSLSCDSIFEKSNPPRLHFSGSSILRSRK